MTRADATDAEGARTISEMIRDKFTRETMEDIAHQHDELVERASDDSAGTAERRDVALETNACSSISQAKGFLAGRLVLVRGAPFPQAPPYGDSRTDYRSPNSIMPRCSVALIREMMQHLGTLGHCGTATPRLFLLGTDILRRHCHR